MTPALPRHWTLSEDRQWVVIGPSGAEYRLAPDRETAVRVVAAVVSSVERSLPGTMTRVRHLMSLAGFFSLAVRGVADAPEDAAGAAVAQWLDVLTWKLEWRDVMP